MFWKKKKETSPSLITGSGSTNPFSGRDKEEDIKSSYTHTPPPSYRAYASSQDNRKELFGDTDSQSGYDGASQQGRPQYDFEDEEDSDVRDVRRQIHSTKKDTVETARRALQKMSEAEESGAKSMQMLGEQGNQIANVRRNLDVAKAQTDDAAQNAEELRKINRSMFIPYISGKNSKSKAKEEGLRHAEHAQERNSIREAQYATNTRIESSKRVNRNQSGTDRFGGRDKSDRNIYQFEANEEDDEMEDEIDDSLDMLSAGIGRLKNIASTMGEEIEGQTKQINDARDRIDPMNEKLRKTTQKLSKIK